MTGAEPVERELKLDIEPVDAQALAAGPWFAGASPVQLVSVYFDTPDKALRKAGYLLRVRHAGERRVQTLKTIARSGAASGLFARGEWEREIAGDQPEIPDADGSTDADGPLAVLLRKQHRARLKPYLRTQVERRSRRLSVGRAEVELVFDQGSVIAGKHSAPICEIEIELVSGKPSALFTLARQIAQTTPLRPAALAKSDRGQLLADNALLRPSKASALTLTPDMPATLAFQQIAASCLHQFLRNVALLPHDDHPDIIHQARVGLRRLRSALSLFRPLLGEPALRLLGGEVRWLAQQLGNVRSLDVLIAASTDVATRTHLARLRRAAFADMLETVASLRVRTLLLDLVQWLSLGAWLRHPQRAPRLDAFAATRLDQRFRRLKRTGAGFASLDDVHRHSVRIEAKKLRYVSEFLATIYGGKQAATRRKAWLATLETLLDALGDLNDEAVAAATLASFGIAQTAVKFDPAKHVALRASADKAFATLPGLKRFWH